VKGALRPEVWHEVLIQHAGVPCASGGLDLVVGQLGLLDILPEGLPGLGRVAGAAELEPYLGALPRPVGLALARVRSGGALPGL
jgi:hypothetical protein